ncbi:MAG: GH92 family glycosyl hydrolase [Bacteroidales bacterium]|nr:GH92 family glycosyl hydrolase [Bacteroidales bacterium]
MKLKALLPAICIIACSLTVSSFAQKSLTSWVNPFVGTGAHGHTYPGATVPFGMVQLSPDTRLEGWDGCSGYHYDDEFLYGFSHTHLNGTGCADLCDILFMPTTGETRWNNGSDGQAGYRSQFKHSSEKASPGYYKVVLDDYNVTAELTATTRVGFHQYTFPASDQSNILVDLFHRDEVLESSLHIISDTQIEGLRRSRSWAEDQYVYFVAEFSKPFESYDVAVDNITRANIKAIDKKKNLKASFHFKTTANEKILVKVGISSVSYEGARKNLKQEIPGWDFNAVREAADATWNKALAKIEVDGGTDLQKAVFYTSLYHTMVQPNTYNDVDGNYRGMDKKIHKAEGFTMYTTFSLWDTYRAYHPLMTIIDQTRTLDYIKTFLAMYDQSGLLPVWELHANETNCMIGYHSVPVIVDAFVKGIKGFDQEKALQAMKASATRDNVGLRAVDQLGYIPSDREAESASRTLEYAYDDWCISQFAKAIGKNDDYLTFNRRGQNFKNLFDPSSGNMRARINGGWYSPFDPTEVNYNYTEANSWQYSFSATQDMTGFIALHGGKENFAKKLDELFNASTKTTGREQSDITGLIGQYAQGNEPSHHITYLYPFAGQPWKTQALVHRILNDFYNDKADGSIGNEDCGQMSAWAVMSAMGIYAVNPGSDFYVIGTPWFDKVTIHQENGKDFVISASNRSVDNYYIQSASLNGKKYGASFLNHKELSKGGELHFEMGAQPNEKWGTGKKNEPVTSISDHVIVPVPYLNDATKVFSDTKEISITAVEGAKIYVLDGKNPVLYTGPIQIKETGKIRFYAELKGVASQWVSAEFIKVKNDKDATLAFPPARQYSGNGASTLVDGLNGTTDYRVGGWLGFEKVNLESVLDLRSVKKVSKFSTGFLQDENSWIFMPLQVEYLVSNDGVNYTSVGVVKNTIPIDQKGSITNILSMTIAPVDARYVKVIATNMGTCPEGHKGFPNASWIFSDEISVE